MASWTGRGREWARVVSRTRPPVRMAVALTVAALLAGGCAVGVETQFARSGSGELVDPATLTAGEGYCLRLRMLRSGYVYAFEESPDGRLRTLLPVAEIHNGSDYFEAGEVIELPSGPGSAKGPEKAPAGAAPATLTLVVTEIKSDALADALRGGVREPNRVRKMVATLRDRNPDAVQKTEARDGWTALYRTQFDVYGAMIRTLTVGAAGSPTSSTGPTGSAGSATTETDRR